MSRMSVQLLPNIGFEGPPPGQQLQQAHGFVGMFLGNGFQKVDLVAHHAKIGDRIDACLLDAPDVGAKCAPTEDDALICCSWGHGVAA